MIAPRFATPTAAYAWYCFEPLPGFWDRTAMQLVQEGEEQQILDFLDALDTGVYS